MKKLIMSSLLLFCFSAYAEEKPKLGSYECTARVVGDSSQEVIEESFTVSGLNLGSHGGFEKTFQNKLHQVVVTADQKWMTLLWFKNKKMVGQTVFAHTGEVVQHRALLLFNPENENDQASLDCMLKDATTTIKKLEFPK